MYKGSHAIRKLFGLLIVGVVVVGAFACGNESATPTSKPAAAPAATSTASAPTATPVAPPATAPASTATPKPTPTLPPPPTKPQGLLTVAQSSIAFPAMMPSRLPVNSGNLIQRWGVHESALDYSYDGPEWVARLVTEWQADPSGLSYTLKLRKGVQFHGGWGEMTADDFKWSFDDSIKADSIHSSIGVARASKATVTVQDPYTFTVTLNGPSIFFFETYFTPVGGGVISVFSKKRVDTLGVDAATLDISDGTGPFKFTKWEQGNEAVLEAVPTYYGTIPEYQTVRIVEMKESAVQIAALQSGQIDVTAIPAPLVSSVKSQPGLEVRGFGVPGSERVYPQGQFCMATTITGTPVVPYPRPGYDSTKPWVGKCDDPVSQENARKVRWALATAIDRQSIVTNILGGFGKPSYLPDVTGPVLDRIFKQKWVIPYDPAKAKSLLKEAGYPNGFDALLRITTGDHPLETEMGQAVAQYWQAIGINVKIQVLTYDANRPAVVARTLSDLWFRSSGGGSPESPEVAQLRRNPENAFNPGLEVRTPLEIISRMDPLRSQKELDVLREELYDWFYNSQAIIPVVLANQLVGINTKKVGVWKMTSAASTIGDFENLKKPR